MREGRARFEQGGFAQAAVHWMAAARLYEERGQTKEQCQALINLSHALQKEGQIRRAQGTLQTALTLSESMGNRVLTATILGQLGTTSHLLGKEEPATEHLTKALGLAREEQQPALVAGVLNDLGNTLVARRQFAEAIDVYTESRNLARDTNQAALAVTAEINGAAALIQDQQWSQAHRQLDHAMTEVQSLEDSQAKTAGLLNIGLGYQDLHSAMTTARQAPQGERQPAGRKQEPGGGTGRGGANLTTGTGLLRQSSNAFTAAGEVAARTGDARGESYAWGYQGELLEKEQRPAEALEASRKASFAAQKVNAPESLYRWQWQTARLLKTTGKEDEALAAYQRAVTLLKPIRYEYSVGYQNRHHSFYDSVAPLFSEYENVLLRRASAAKTPEQSEQWLVQVKDTVETSHAAELQDYFQEDCVGAVRTQGRKMTIPHGTAVLYPISFPDRLELVMETADGLKQVTVPVSGDKLTKEIRTFRRQIQDQRSQNYLPAAQALHGWLMAPLERNLQAASITTLVMVAQGPLRTIPVGALHDGRQFVVDKLALAVTPSLELTDLASAPRRKGSLLSVGLTESVEGMSAPRYADAEVQAIRTLYGGKLLMNKQFSTPSLEEEIKDQGVGIVHVASHTVVASDPRNSFVLAHDGRITMDRLSQLVGLQQYRQQPLDLLTLSACETPADDDRAALGLNGVAVKTGARTALVSLWMAEDETTSELISEFYRQLQDPALSKAVALQRAQQKILAQRGHSHPSFWAAFLLINNWM
jgi:CHAT domain-containing protein